MAVDPRLASVELLAMAAMRVKHQQVSAPPKTVTMQVVYVDWLGVEPDELGERYTYTLPPDAPGGRAC